MTTQDKDRIECAIRHIQTSVDIDPWAVEIAVEAMEKMLKDLPSVQPEIIRCRDCKHWREGTTYSYCDKLFGMGVLDIYDYMTTEDDYCSFAERKNKING